jgi:AAA domain
MEKSANAAKPITYQADLAKLPRCLRPLVARPQWAVWRWVPQPDGRWTKPPFMAMQPNRHASTSNPGTWADHATALAVVQAGQADGISYILTEQDPFAALDLDHCRRVDTHSIDVWAQNFLEQGRNTYTEVTPSGSGCRIWGLAHGGSLHRKFTLNIDGRDVALELFRRTNKALTITGYKLDNIRELADIDRVLDYGVLWGEHRKAAAAAPACASINGVGGNESGSGYSVDQIEQFVRSGAPVGLNRSNLFHTIVGHYVGCGWNAGQILAHLQQFPQGIGERYLGEGRLSGEIARSISKFDPAKLPPLFGNSWETKPPQGEPKPQKPAPDGDPELEEKQPREPDEEPGLEKPDEDELGEDGEDFADEALDLPPMFAHGDPDPRPLKSWLIKGLIPTRGHGLLSGQWGAGKTFVAFDLAAAVMTGQPFLGHATKRQCGVLFLAAEGADGALTPRGRDPKQVWGAAAGAISLV